MSYQVIARKWRPQTFRDLVGQTHVTETLANAIKNNRVAHAYIFSGARGVGKTTAARILAKALNCVKGPTPGPCGECDSCKEIAAGTSLDVIEIDAASNRGIDQIRELREMVRYAPASARSKVVILDEAHMLTGEASNAEISGRLKEIAEKENLKIEPGAMAVIARMAEGSLRDALSLLEQARAYCGDTISDKEVRELLGVVPDDALDELVGAIAEASADRALALVHTFQREGRNLQHFCREAIRHMRNLLIARVCGAESDLIAATPDQRPALAKAAEQFSEEDLTRFFQILLQTDDDLRRKPDPRVHLEMGLLRLINASRLAPLEELLADLRAGVSATATVAGSSRAASSATLPSMPKREAHVAAASPAPQAVGTAAGAEGAAAVHAAGQTKSNGTITRVDGISVEQVAAIKAALQAQHKFLGELVEHASRWELEGSELRIYFSPEKRPFAEMLEGRESLEKVRVASSTVLGRAVRVCAKLEGVKAAAARAASGTQELRGQFERDPMVRSMLQRFGGKISEVKRRQEEP